MSEIDQHTSDAIARLRDEWSPPDGAEDRMLADFHARLGGPPDGGDAPAGDGGSGSVGAAGHGLYVAKIILAVAGLTAVGLGGVIVAAKLMRAVEREPPTLREQPVATAVSDEVEPVEPTPVETIEPEPIAAAPLDAPPSAPVAQPKPRARAESKVDLAAELALLREARTAKPEQALALLDRHAREFPTGALTSEREALRAVALCTLDRLADAQAAVDRLVALDPGPLLRQRVSSACEQKIDLPTTVFARGGDGSP